MRERKMYYYTNKLGIEKKLLVDYYSNSNYCHISFWNETTYEFCGEADTTLDVVQDLLTNYTIKKVITLQRKEIDK